MIAFIESLKDDTCTPKPAKLNAWVYIYMQFCATVSKVAIILPIVVPMANVNPFGAST